MRLADEEKRRVEALERKRADRKKQAEAERKKAEVWRAALERKESEREKAAAIETKRKHDESLIQQVLTSSWVFIYYRRKFSAVSSFRPNWRGRKLRRSRKKVGLALFQRALLSCFPKIRQLWPVAAL